MQLLIQHEDFRKLLCSVIYLFNCIGQSMQSLSKLMAFTGEIANVIALGHWQYSVHLLTKEAGVNDV